MDAARVRGGECEVLSEGALPRSELELQLTRRRRRLALRRRRHRHRRRRRGRAAGAASGAVAAAATAVFVAAPVRFSFSTVASPDQPSTARLVLRGVVAACALAPLPPFSFSAGRLAAAAAAALLEAAALP